MSDRESLAHPFMPSSAGDAKATMLASIGAPSVDALFEQIPADHRTQRPLALPAAIPSESALRAHLLELLNKNASCEENLSFLGGGCWRHYVPAVCDEIVGRSEFLTSVWGTSSSDHGRNQAWFEFCSQLGELLGLEMVGLPVYSWGCAAGHALRMGSRITQRRRVLVPRNICPERLSIIRNYCGLPGMAGSIEVELVDYDKQTGLIDIDALAARLQSQGASSAAAAGITAAGGARGAVEIDSARDDVADASAGRATVARGASATDAAATPTRTASAVDGAGDAAAGRQHASHATSGADGARSPTTSAVAAVYIETPSFFGLIEPRMNEIARITHAAGAELVVGADPLSLGVLAAPAEYGADIVVGSTQPLGIHMHGGGGLGGFIASRDEPRYAQEYPTLMLSITDTVEPGERGFGMSLIHQSSYGSRDKGKDWTGNSTYLWAIASAVYMSMLGPKGFQELGTALVQRSHYAAKRLSEIKGIRIPYKTGFFKEFLVNVDDTGRTIADLNRALRSEKIFGGQDLSQHFPDLGQSALYCVTELHTQADIERLAAAIRKWSCS
jgi:glycine cleavage system pyridoxal-binding protein P